MPTAVEGKDLIVAPIFEWSVFPSVASHALNLRSTIRNYGGLLQWFTRRKPFGHLNELLFDAEVGSLRNMSVRSALSS